MRFLIPPTPHSLYWRFLLIILLPVILAQALAVYMFYERHWSNMHRNRSHVLAGEVGLMVREFEHATPAQRENITLTALQYMQLSMHFTPGEPVVLVPHEAAYHILHARLQTMLEMPFTVMTDPDTEHIVVQVQLADGLLTLRASHKRLDSPTTYIFILWMTGGAGILTIISLLFLRGQLRSIVRLAEAASRFGKGQESSHFKPQGAREIRMAGMAFMEMRERIHRLLTRRTQMLAAVSHDLRTPLTRLKLQLALLEAHPKIREMEKDIAEMESMLEGYLTFARDDDQQGVVPFRQVSLPGFLQEIVADYAHHPLPVTLGEVPQMDIELNPETIKRVLRNLLDNALRYAKSTVLISARQEDAYVNITIEDDGPGIPKERREEMFQPFTRMDSARRQHTGGSGLGLAIARDLAHRHGGDVTLHSSKRGGLLAILALPI